RVLGVLGKFGRLRIGPAHHVTGVLDYGHLHTQADAQVRDFVLTGVLHGADFAFHATVTETTRYQNSVDIGQHISAFTLNVFGIDITHIHLGAVLDTGMVNGFDQ